MRFAFITVGDPRRLTGGYLYHARVFAGLRARGIDIVELIGGPADPAQQRAHAATFSATFDPRDFDVVVVDALACPLVADWLDQWRAVRPLVGMVHELPSVAGTAGVDPAWEAPLLRADRLITVSAHGQAILHYRGAPAERIRIVTPGYDRLPPPAAPPATRGPLRALCVAQWIPRKGIHDLIAAWTARPRPAAVLDLIGETAADPQYTAGVRAAIARAPKGAIRVHGAVSDAELERAYQTSAFFVLPSRYEGYGMVFAEALAYGLPVVACAVSPVKELVGAAGLFAPPADPAALATVLDRILSDAVLRAELAQAATERVAALPSWKDATVGFLDVLQDALARSI